MFHPAKLHVGGNQQPVPYTLFTSIQEGIDRDPAYPLMIIPPLDCVWPTLLEMLADKESNIDVELPLGAGNRSAVIFPAILQHLELNQDSVLSYHVVDAFSSARYLD